VVIHLPDSKHVVIDSKVSISAYTRSVQTDDPDQQALELTAHVNSIRSHMSGLSAKNYQDLYGLGAIDFVLMFIPIEPAFLAAISHQSGLFQEALQKNIVLVCPSTLHATMRTIAHVWRQEHQNRNAQEIARQCAALYDKFVGFVSDLDNVGDKISQTQKSFDEAYKKLSTGNGNLVRTAQKVRELGVKPNKSLPTSLVEKSEE
jgi:DNA recombination protein RmuC